MFPTSGYYRGVTCPYFASGLCERPYCHFRHVKSEENTVTDVAAYLRLTSSDDATSVTTTLSAAGGSQPPQKAGGSLLSVVGDAIKKVQLDIERDKARLHNLKGDESKHGKVVISKPSVVNNVTPLDPNNRYISSKAITIPNARNKKASAGAIVSYNPTPITGKCKYPATNLKESVQHEALQKYEPAPAYPKKELAPLPNGSRKLSTPAYNPTPIKLLQEKTKNPQKFPPGVVDESSMEYDPSSNYLTKGKTNATYGTKRTTDAENESASKRRRTDSSDLDDAKFSSDDDDDGGMEIDVNVDIDLSDEEGASESKSDLSENGQKKYQLDSGSVVNKQNSNFTISKKENIFAKFSTEIKTNASQVKKDSPLNGFVKATDKEKDDVDAFQGSTPCVPKEENNVQKKESDSVDISEQVNETKEITPSSGNLTSMHDSKSQSDKKEKTPSSGNLTSTHDLKSQSDKKEKTSSSGNLAPTHDSKSQSDKKEKTLSARHSNSTDSRSPKHGSSSSRSSSKEKSSHHHQSNKSSSSSGKSSSSSSNKKSSSSSNKPTSNNKSSSSHHSHKEKHHRTSTSSSSSKTSADKHSSSNSKYKHHSSSQSNHHKSSKKKKVPTATLR